MVALTVYTCGQELGMLNLKSTLVINRITSNTVGDHAWCSWNKRVVQVYNCLAVVVQKAQVIKLGQLHAFSIKAKVLFCPWTSDTEQRASHAFQPHRHSPALAPLVGLVEREPLQKWNQHNVSLQNWGFQFMHMHILSQWWSSTTCS